MKSKHGDYNIRTHRIRIFNLYRADMAILATTIHELSHHVDNINCGNTDYCAESYKVFQHLLYTSLNMNIFSKDEFMSANKDASDSNKIAKMIKDYEPVNIRYKDSVNKIVVYNCFTIKDTLKDNGFSYNSINHIWEKEVDENELPILKDFLDGMEAEYKIVDVNYISFDKRTYIVAVKGSYDVKDFLKESGFFFDIKGKCWKKEVKSDEARKVLQDYISQFPMICFQIK